MNSINIRVLEWYNNHCRCTMKKINHSINDKANLAIILSYVFYVLGRTLPRSDMNEIIHTDGSIKSLMELIEHKSNKVLSETSKRLWDGVKESLKASEQYKQEGTIFPYNSLDEEQLLTIIKATESQLSLPVSTTFPFKNLLDEVPLKDNNDKIIIGYELPMITDYVLEDKNVDVIVFDLYEYVVAMIHSELFHKNRVRVHKIESEKQLVHLLEQSNVTVIINELSKESKSSPFLSMFYSFKSIQMNDERLSLSWLMINSLIYRFQSSRIVSFVDEKDLRHRSFMRMREVLVNDKHVECVLSVQGAKHSTFNLISIQPAYDSIMMKAINYDGSHFMVENAYVKQEVIEKTKFSILSPFDYTSSLLLDNSTDLASVAQIFSGYQVGLRRLKSMDDHDKQVEVRMVSMPHLNKFEVLTPNDEYLIQVGRNVITRFEIQENDILIASKSNDPKPTIVKNKPVDQIWIANSSLIVIRAKSHPLFTAEYLFAYLSSDQGLSQLKRLQRGNIVFITTKQISDVLVEELDSDEHQRITQSVIDLIKTHQQLSKELKRVELQFERIIM